MELWIRTQRKERLCKTSNFVIREANLQGYYAIAENRNKNTIEYGIYKTKERALEVLDEIQKYITPTLSLLDDTLNGKQVCQVGNILTMVYEMPKD